MIFDFITDVVELAAAGIAATALTANARKDTAKKKTRNEV